MRNSSENTPNVLTPRPREAAAVDLAGKRVLVAGLGASGLAVARFLSERGAAVTVSELRKKEQIDPDALGQALALDVELETGGHKAETFERAEMIVLSPGVPHDAAPIRSARDRGVPVAGELELASRFIRTPILAVTGTNGKSTVATFIGEMLENAGFRVFVGGNIGTPLTAYAAGDQRADYVVAEVSSFQLDTIETFRPLLSVILNVTPDHLDRYPDFEAYACSKLRVFQNQGPGQYAVLNDEDPRLSRAIPPSGVVALRYGMEEGAGRNAFVQGGVVRTRLEGEEGPSFETGAFRLPGAHNLENLLACILAGLALRLPPSAVQKTINGFSGLANRIEFVGEVKGIEFYNDSKATNVDAAVRAVASFDRPLILVAGGRHKGGDYAPLVEAARGSVKRAVFLGEAKGLLAASFEGALPYSLADDMEEAVTTAFSSAESGDVVLLAPACSSFDMFSDYAQRGKVFRSIVERLRRL